MPGLRRCIPWVIAIAILLSLGLWAGHGTRSSTPLDKGSAAYQSSNWREASSQARQQLDQSPQNLLALRLLARASSRLGEDETAQALYSRLGADSLTGEDYYLIGTMLLRQRESSQALVVLRKAANEEPQNPEILFDLTRLLAKSDQLLEAVPLARKIARIPGWEARGSFVLALLLRELNDSQAASAALSDCLHTNPTLEGLPASPSEIRKLFARTMLESNHATQAEPELRRVLSHGADPEASWLLSRVWLQENDHTKALEALQKSKDYSEVHVMAPESAPYVGSLACASCHPAIYRSQQRSRHSKTFHAAKKLATLAVPGQPVHDPVDQQIVHTFSLDKDKLCISTRLGDKQLQAVVDYAFGSGDRGLTFVGHEKSGQSRELRLSRYERGAVWDRTSGQFPVPSDRDEFLGRPLTADGVRRCILCHTTSAVVAESPAHPESSDRAIGCERCHGPGGNHIIATKHDFPDIAIMRPKLASASQITALCGQCHSPRGSPVDPSDATSVRFQAATLTWSRCYAESEGALSCVSCHSPHDNAVTESAAYEPRCLTCHSTETVEAGQHIAGTRPITLADQVVRKACPINTRTGCIDCHMPKVVDAIPHSPFTDHYIRVHRRQADSR